MGALIFQGAKKEVVDAILQAINKTGQIAFNESQNNVPVITGALKQSGSIATTINGVIIKYAQEYASFVEKDWEGGRIWTSAFMRSNGIWVKGHYKNQPPRVGKHFIENALRKHFIETLGTHTTFQINLLEALKIKFNGQNVREI